MLSGELGLEFLLYDDGSRSSMPDLLSADRKHVAEVVTTSLPAVREAEQHLDPLDESRLPHCVWVTIPYPRLGGVTKGVRHSIKADVLRWTAEAGCDYHWLSHDGEQLLKGNNPDPILGLRSYDDGIRVMCVQVCRHSNVEPHQISWPVVHAPSPEDPWRLVRRSLHIIDTEHRGGVQALAEKLSGYPNKHLVMYPFGPPGNLTAALSHYALPPILLEMLPPRLNPPLADLHLWLIYQYGGTTDTEGLHVCNGRWSKFGTQIPKLDLHSPLMPLHYRDA
ncbi:hypothetical protein DC31_00020 [Microbacterium sp. CH12i]|uniref:hypothetical protein n=1 Tax=Microbacterium sp. CH12i TaxID=1479651 RepID=UPI00046143A6|nr:hypothetical protein [Microbacterium sp. CH12i]KDA07165.1 hypothetical protein DC31_00020 [Microbacterium sp. CH12i]